MSDKCKMSSKTASTSAPTTAADEEADPRRRDDHQSLQQTERSPEKSRGPRQLKELRRAMQKHGIDTSSMTDEQILQERQRNIARLQSECAPSRLRQGSISPFTALIELHLEPKPYSSYQLPVHQAPINPKP